MKIQFIFKINKNIKFDDYDEDDDFHKKNYLHHFVEKLVGDIRKINIYFKLLLLATFLF